MTAQGERTQRALLKVWVGLRNHPDKAIREKANDRARWHLEYIETGRKPEWSPR